MDAIVLSRLTTTPLRRPSDGLSPTPRIVTGVPGSSDSAMTTATRDVPRSRPTVFFRSCKTVLERRLELLHLGPYARGYVALVVGHRVVQVEHRLVERDQGVLARRRQAGGALRVHSGQRLVGLHQRRPEVDVEEAVRALVVGDEW